MDTGRPAQARITSHGLFADLRGRPGATPLLFLPGGPGQGCYDFMAIQGERLGRTARVIGLDQRGVDRSAPLPDGARLTIADLVEDCEEVRRELGIERWAVLGHSFGGGLALRYAAAHPRAVSAVIFENPAWDVGMSVRAALPVIAAMLTSRGLGLEARAARAAAEREASPRGLRAAYLAALSALGPGREEFFVPEPGTRARLAGIHLARHGREGGDGQAGARDGEAGAGDGEAAGEAGSLRHHEAILAGDAYYESLLPLLPRLPVPALLITGGRDPITSPPQREAFLRASPRNKMAAFPSAGHYVHADEPGPYAEAVEDFLGLSSAP